MSFRLISCFVVSWLLSLSVFADCPSPTHEELWVKTSVERHRAIVLTVLTEEPQERGTIVGCVFIEETSEPLANLTFELFQFEGAIRGGGTPAKEAFEKYAERGGYLKTKGRVIEVTTDKAGRLIVEGLAPGSYALVPNWPTHEGMEKIGVDLDIRVTTDVGIGLSRSKGIS